MIIDAYSSPYLSSFMYVIRENQQVVVIDPYPCESIMSETITVDNVLLTHEHFDHISGVNVFKSKYHPTVLCTESCAMRLNNPKKNMSAYYDVFTSIPEFEHYANNAVHVEPYSCEADGWMTEDVPLLWEGHTFRLVSTPGHTVGSACYVLDDKYLFSGDTLFESMETSTQFPSGSMAALRVSAPKLLQLNDETLVLPGHFDRFTLGKRKDYLKRIAKAE